MIDENWSEGDMIDFLLDSRFEPDYEKSETSNRFLEDEFEDCDFDDDLDDEYDFEDELRRLIGDF